MQLDNVSPLNFSSCFIYHFVCVCVCVWVFFLEEEEEEEKEEEEEEEEEMLFSCKRRDQS